MPIGTNKQTEEERLANIAELEKLNPKDPDLSEEDDATPPVTPPDDVTPPEDDGADATPPVVTPPAEDKKPPVDDQKTDYEKKFQDSSREAQVLALRNKKYQEKIDAAENLPDPTDEECATEYGEAWEERDDIDKGIARQVLKDKRYREIIKSVHKEQKAEEEQYNAAVEFAIKPDIVKQFPAIDGRQEEFGRFASKESRRGLDLEDLAAVFVISRPVRNVPSGSMTERSNASAIKSKPVAPTLDVAHAAVLRTSRQKAYNESLKSGKFDPRKIDFGKP